MSTFIHKTEKAAQIWAAFYYIESATSANSLEEVYFIDAIILSLSYDKNTSILLGDYCEEFISKNVSSRYNSASKDVIAALRFLVCAQSRSFE